MPTGFSKMFYVSILSGWVLITLSCTDILAKVTESKSDFWQLFKLLSNLRCILHRSNVGIEP
jgi:hypothetical protein